MSSQFFGLNIAYTGLLASNAALNTTSNNISNVHTEGYSRQQVKQQAANALRIFQTYGCAGAGVETLAIERVRDEFYDTKFWNNNSRVGEYEMKRYYMEQVETYFDDNGQNAGFKTVFDQLMILGLQELMKNPSSDTTKAQFVGYAGSLTEYFNGLAGNMENLQKDVNQEIKLKVDEINSLAGEIANLNKQINTIELAGGKANELRDRRTLLLDQLSKIVDIETVENPVTDTNNPDRETGATRFLVKIAGGQLLVDSNEYRRLECVARASYEKVNQTDIDGLYDIYWNDGQEFNLYNQAMGGDLKGLIEMRDGNNNENFTGTVTGIGSVTDSDGTKHDTVTVQVYKEYLKDMNKCNLSDQGGIINLGNQEFYYDSWEYSISYDDDGEPVYSYTFTLSTVGGPDGRNSAWITTDRLNKTANIGSSVDYQGVPYYMSQMNEWIRTFAQKFNDIITNGYNSNNEKGIKMFVADHITDEEQYDFPDETRYDLYFGMTREEALENLRESIYDSLYKQKHMEFFAAESEKQYVAPSSADISAQISAIEKEYQKADPDVNLQDPDIVSEIQQKATERAEENARKAADQKAKAYADEQMKQEDVLADIKAQAAADAEAAFDGTGFTLSADDDSYYRLTAKNLSILAAMVDDPSLMAHKSQGGDGVEQSDLLTALKNMVNDKTKLSFRGSSASEFLQNILSDVALNANRANTFSETYEGISYSIDNQRISISGVDEDEEAVNLVKYQNGYNLASKMIQTLTEIYDRLILETGV